MKSFFIKNSSSIQLIVSTIIGILIAYYINILTGEIVSSESQKFSLFGVFKSLGWTNLFIVIGFSLIYFQIYISRISKNYHKFHVSKVVHKILEASAQSLIYPKNDRHIRAIVTIHDGNNKTRSTRFSYNTLSDPERIAKFPLFFGITGKAYQTKSVILEELPIKHHEKYDSSTKNNVLPQIRTILAAPILDPLNMDNLPIGVLAFDSKLTLKTLGWDQDRTRKIAQDWADTIGQLLTYSDI